MPRRIGRHRCACGPWTSLACRLDEPTSDRWSKPIIGVAFFQLRWYGWPMSERDGFAPGVPCWVDTWQPDATTAAAFYAALLGWETDESTPDDAEARYVMCRVRGRDAAAIGRDPGWRDLRPLRPRHPPAGVGHLRPGRRASTRPSRRRTRPAARRRRVGRQPRRRADRVLADPGRSDVRRLAARRARRRADRQRARRLGDERPRSATTREPRDAFYARDVRLDRRPVPARRDRRARSFAWPATSAASRRSPSRATSSP